MQDCTNCDSSLNDKGYVLYVSARPVSWKAKSRESVQISIMLYQLYQFTWQLTIILHRLKEPIDLISSENASAVMDEG